MIEFELLDDDEEEIDDVLDGAFFNTRNTTNSSLDDYDSELESDDEHNDYFRRIADL